MREYRASSLGGCVKEQAALQLGYKPLMPPVWLQAMFDKGNEHEDECVAALIEQGYKVEDQQAEVALLLASGVRIPGHLDGTIRSEDSDERVLEIKSPGAYAQFERAHKTGNWSESLVRKYRFQIAAYMLATGLEAMIVCLDDGQLRWFVIETPPATLADIEIQVAGIEALVEAGVLPSFCDVDGGEGCSVRYLHTDTKPDRTVITDETIIAAATEYEGFTHQESVIKKCKKELRVVLDSAFSTVGDYTAGEVDITVFSRKNPAKLDEEAMKRDGIDVESYRKSDGESVAMKVTPRKGA